MDGARVPALGTPGFQAGLRRLLAARPLSAVGLHFPRPSDEPEEETLSQGLDLENPRGGRGGLHTRDSNGDRDGAALARGLTAPSSPRPSMLGQVSPQPLDGVVKASQPLPVTSVPMPASADLQRSACT